MCGIVGFTYDDRALIRKMADKIAHRGPDDCGYYIDNNISLGQRRLKIIDLTPGIYPIHNEDCSMQLVFNGEIFNYKLLRDLLIEKGHRFYTNCDAEVIVHLYEQWGMSGLKLLRGQFALGLWTGHILVLARDQIGIRPLYYSYYNDNIYFASEAKALLEIIPAQVNEHAHSLYKVFDCVPAPYTMFSGINKLEPGQFLIAEKTAGHIDYATYKYWDLAFDRYPPGAKDELYERLGKAIEEQMMSDVPIGMYLSGGLDSSTVLAHMSKYTHKVKTVTVGFDSSEPVNELDYARPVAEKFNTDHHELVITEKSVENLKKIVWHLDEPVANPTIIPLFELSDYAKRNGINVSLAGSGGDELFAGYRQHVWVTKLAKKPWLHYLIPLYKQFYNHSNRYIQFGSKFLSYANCPKDAYNQLVFRGRGENILNEYNLFTKHVSVLNQVTEAEFKTTLANQYLFMEDKMNMAHAVEGRVPLLDTHVVDYVLSLPDSARLNGNTTKYILRQVMKKDLPVNNVKRPKNGFTVPFKAWYKSSMKPMFAQYQPHSPLLDKDTNENVNEAFSQLVFELWKDNFISG